MPTRFTAVIVYDVVITDFTVAPGESVRTFALIVARCLVVTNSSVVTRPMPAAVVEI